MTDQSTAVEKGVWSETEHTKFLEGLKLFPEGPWKDIAAHIGTRSSRQVQTHAQKYYEKVGRRMRGLRKDRKKLTRLEHRLGEDMKELCTVSDLAETSVRIGQIRRGLKAVASSSARAADDASTDASEASWTEASNEEQQQRELSDTTSSDLLDWVDALFQDEELASWIPETEVLETDSLHAIDDHCLNYLVEILEASDLSAEEEDAC